MKRITAYDIIFQILMTLSVGMAQQMGYDWFAIMFAVCCGANLATMAFKVFMGPTWTAFERMDTEQVMDLLNEVFKK